MSTRGYAARLAAVAAGLGSVMALAGCGGGEPSGAATPSTTSPTSASAAATTPATTTSTTTTARPSTTTKRPRPAPKPSRATPTAVKTTRTRPASQKPPPASSCGVPSGVTAPQVVLVDSSGSGATIRACRRSGSGYTTELGPYYGHVGRNGVSASKREGDLRTPAGVFPLREGFGVYANPGLRVGSWRQVDAQDVWVDDSASSLYNTHQRTPANGRWSSAEKLLNQPAYNYAQVIGYNEARTPGKGSAIFLHVDKGGGTAGCVSLPTGPLLAVLRWERAGAVIAIR
ncbi:MAG TPA: hypothetical protein VFK43_22505 [Acidimicrobiales bacterium]|nr:hypothetical protein [Acidimicrobiales bacterium]